MKYNSFEDFFTAVNNKLNNLIESYKDKQTTPEVSASFQNEWEGIFFNELDINGDNLKKKIGNHAVKNADSLIKNIEYIAIFNKFDLANYKTEKPQMVEAITTLCKNPQNWRVFNVNPDPESGCLKIIFGCSAINSGNDLVGYAYVNLNGKLKHHFTEMYNF